MFFFITFLRAFGAMIITNAHYTTIYPYPILASGGLLGDVIFFAVSGYCISQIKDNFLKWYKGRVIRVYTPVYIITAIYLVLGFYNLKRWNMLE
ncbi:MULTISPECIES: hypothetical protein [Psychrilyobacter]|uniref:Acyltransferase 3 domain-containing protein n=1 Tax=Psychrilyobacter piezotolerans TaxID=2293438 RepID=A0ABX9KDS9_9FUSO|nr:MULTISPECIES: hypothetical protein [Psychrilyobacter]MCS5422115.1 hypothetical protein [Psychrilyobacter sp. S5]NDI76288.1 hypothetical protein [Psychrilyobacter piezotolerans]RDE59174.1 hypothetical protein DV867_13670 [Psychrilyobacter sp. S5]REI39736.1 hypothetical protein DYH56_13670 [Psychrilyobacter piezotolerans]